MASTKMLAALCSVTLGVQPAPAKPSGGGKLLVVTSPWDGYTNPDGTGIYFDVLNAALGKDNYTARLVPWRRARAEFERNQADALLGEDSLREAVYPKWPIDINHLSVVFLKRRFPSFRLELLKRHRVVWIRGYDIGRILPGIDKVEEVEEVHQGVKMVAASHTDFFIDYEESIVKEIAAAGLERQDFEIVSDQIKAGFLYLCFQDNAKGRSFADRFDQGMERAHKAGRLEDIYANSEWIPVFKAILDEIGRLRKWRAGRIQYGL